MTAYTPHVIAVSGQIGAGKTTLTMALRDALGWRAVASYSDVVRVEAVAHGRIPDRATLQEVGAALAARWSAFNRRVLDQARWRPHQGAVIDGVRHVAAVESLAELVAPVPVLLVYLVIDPRRGLDRALDRDSSTTSWSELAHPVEQDLANVHELAERMGLVLSGADPTEVNVAAIIARLARATIPTQFVWPADSPAPPPCNQPIRTVRNGVRMLRGRTSDPYP